MWVNKQDLDAAFLVSAEGAIVRTTFRPHLALLAVFDERQALRLDPLKRKGALG